MMPPLMLKPPDRVAWSPMVVPPTTPLPVTWICVFSVGLALFCLRYMIPESRWSDRAAKISFWSLNLGLTWMVFGALFPLGILQLYHSVSHGYFDARTLQFITGGANPVLEWLRFPGDVVFIVGGVLPIVYLCWLGVRCQKPVETTAAAEEILFTEVVE